MTESSKKVIYIKEAQQKKKEVQESLVAKGIAKLASKLPWIKKE